VQLRSSGLPAVKNQQMKKTLRK